MNRIHSLLIFSALLCCLLSTSTVIFTKGASIPTQRDATTPEPIQLIAPDDDHSGFLLKDEGLEALEALKPPIAIISAVGNIHTGKSFLLNQLMGRMSGFPLGYTVNPGTTGLWMWSTTVYHSNGEVKLDKSSDQDQEVSMLLIDSEGFHGPNVSKSYDQTLYAIASLLSTEVLFVTVKMMDSRDLEYLEELTKGANLFALRAYARSVSSLQVNSVGASAAGKLQASHIFHGSEETTLSSGSGEMSPNSEALLRKHADSAAIMDSLSPSCLSWVVQDFIQDLDGKTPLEWLNALIDSTPRSSTAEQMKANAEFAQNEGRMRLNAQDGGNKRSKQSHSLRDMYETINSVTLPAPAEADSMQKLDTLKKEDLLPYYVREMSIFRKQIFERAVKNTKRKGRFDVDKSNPHSSASKSYLTGADLADLIRFLVKAANQNFFDDIDIFMDQFLQVRADVTKNDLKRLYDAAMMAFLSRSPPPLPEEVRSYSNELYMRTLAMWKQHILGDSGKDWAKATQTVLEQSLLSVEADYAEKALESIRAYCRKHTQWLAVKDDAAISEKRSTLPVVKSKMEDWVHVQNSRSREYLKTLINVDGRTYSEVPVCSDEINAYQRHFLELYNELKKSNNVAIVARYDTATKKAVEKFYKLLREKKNVVAIQSEWKTFQEYIFNWKISAISEFKNAIGDLYLMSAETSDAEHQLHINLREPEEEGKRMWTQECSDRCKNVIKRWEGQLRKETLEQVQLPVEEDTLSKTVEALVRTANEEMETLYCAGAPIWKSKVNELEIQLSVIHKALENENIEAIKRYFEEPLASVTTDLADEAEKYAFWSSFSKLALRKANAIISKNMDANESSSMYLSNSLVLKVTQNWLEKEVWEKYSKSISRNFQNLMLTILGVTLLLSAVIIFLFFHWITLGILLFICGLISLLGLKFLSNLARNTFKGFITYTFILISDLVGFELACAITLLVIVCSTLYGASRLKLFSSSNSKPVNLSPLGGVPAYGMAHQEYYPENPFQRKSMENNERRMYDKGQMPNANFRQSLNYPRNTANVGMYD